MSGNRRRLCLNPRVSGIKTRVRSYSVVKYELSGMECAWCERGDSVGPDPGDGAGQPGLLPRRWSDWARSAGPRKVIVRRGPGLTSEAH